MQGVVLLGRDREIDRLRRLVAEQRLVTVTGDVDAGFFRVYRLAH
jgi:hypothetical protein